MSFFTIQSSSWHGRLDNGGPSVAEAVSPELVTGRGQAIR